MSATTFTDTRGRGGHRTRLSERWAVESWALPTILVIAGLNFFWQLGSSSYFIDEAFSVIHSLPALHTVFNLITHQKNGETTPPTYFLFLHEWMVRTGSQAEWVTRLPSAVAGVALVGATYWMACAFLVRRAALAASGLCAISPLVLSYAQETRAYAFVMLACVVCVGATVRASHRTKGRTRLLIVGAVAAVLAVWLHYIAVSVLLPLLIWVAARSELTRRQRLCFIAVCLAGVASVLPILLDQYHNYVGAAITGAINWTNLVSVTGTPFATRVGTPVDLRTLAGALVCLTAVLVLLITRPGDVRHRHLLAALGAFGILALIGVDLTGKQILITRYTTITAPFLLTAIAAACTLLPRPAAIALAAVALATAIAGVIDDHSRSGFYAPVRDAVRYIEPRVQPHEFLLSPGFPLTDTTIFYYDTRLLRPKLQFFGLHDSRVPLAFRTHTRVWIIDNPPRDTTASALASVESILRRNHWHAVSARVYSSSIDLGVLLTAPDARRHAAGA